MEASLLAGLNQAQRAAVTSTSNVLQVLAPPGSGKTKTLTTRVAHLLFHHGYNPQNVICCTFTIKAAREMRDRLRSLVGSELEGNLVLGTFHSICRRYLVAYGQLIGIRKGFGIADSSDCLRIVKKICKKYNCKIDPKTARSRISSNKAKNKRLIDLPQSSKYPEHQEFRQIYEEYETALATSNLLDYDDLLLRCMDLLQQHPTCAANIEAFLVDEFQDTNIVQFELMKLFAAAQGRITIVGDPDQSIYGFRSAEIENLKRMKACYPETVVINLEENYRSSSAILRLAQDVIEQDSDRPDKKLKATHCYSSLPVLRRLPNAHEEALWTTAEIRRMLAMTGGLLQHSDIAILIRSAYLSLLIEKSLSSAGIPYRMAGGMRFFDRAEIRLIVDYLRTISHPENDSAFLSIINIPARKIGDVTIASFVKLGDEESLPIWQVIKKVLSGKLKPDKKMSPQTESDLHKLINIINDARKKMDTTNPPEVPSMLIEYLVSKLCLPSYLQKKFKDDYEDRIENIQEFHTHAKEMVAISSDVQIPEIEGVEQQQTEGSQECLDQFLANISLSTEVENNNNGDEKPRVTISTIHSAKGLEWPIVFIPAVYEGSLPHSRAEEPDEERRLFYVAMTRAKALLTMTFPLMQTREQEHTTLTPFLPTDIHKRMSDVGPKFSDELVADISTILRREMPSQEALTKGLQSIGSTESAEDDLWPSDGSHRMTAERLQSLQPVAGMSLQEALKRNNSTFEKASTFSPTTSYQHQYGLETTMSKSSEFSAANTSLGFTTANHQLKNAPVSQPSVERWNSNPEVEKKKTKLERAKSAQGNIASFFAKPSTTSTSTQQEQVRPDVFPSRNPLFSRQTPAVPKVSNIPSELSTHRLKAFSNPRPHLSKSNSTSNPITSSPHSLPNPPRASLISSNSSTPQLHSHTNFSRLKRPRSPLEPTSPNRRKAYVFHSTSPQREGKDPSMLGEIINLEEEREVHTDEDSNEGLDWEIKRILGRSRDGDIQEQHETHCQHESESQGYNQVQSQRPSQGQKSAQQQSQHQGLTSINSNSSTRIHTSFDPFPSLTPFLPPTTKRNLGVRGPMRGWADRKNR
jgi:DNA helicase II / ATP-dependent DNA helicase PcrA